MIDHLLYNKEKYFPYRNLNYLVGKHMHKLEKKIPCHVAEFFIDYSDPSNALISRISVSSSQVPPKDAVIKYLFSDSTGTFISDGSYDGGQFGVNCWKLTDYLNAGGIID